MKSVADFYDQHPYPASEHSFVRTVDPLFWTPHPYQSVGHWDRRVDSNTRIWVLGCGTRQAIDVALRYPMASVLATDASPKTIELVRDVADTMCLDNLKIVRLDFDERGADATFDLIICTGVAHHFERTDWLSLLRTSLASDGILELFVYNEAHRYESHRFQEAARMFYGRNPTLEEAERLVLLHGSTSLKALVAGTPEGERADLLIHPHEHLYTLESLLELCDRSRMSLLQPVLSDSVTHPTCVRSWMTDQERWVMTDLLSPQLLMFYLQRANAHRLRKSTAKIQEELAGLPKRAVTTKLEKWNGTGWEPHSTYGRTWVVS